MKNVAILIPNLKSGGSERIASRISLTLKDKLNVYMILFDDRDISYKYGGKLICIDSLPKKTVVGKIINIIKRIMVVRGIIKKEKIDVILSFTSAADNVNALCGTKAKRIVSCRGAAYLKANLKLHKYLCKFSDGILFNSEELRKIYLKEFPDDKNKTFTIYNLFDIENIREKAKESLEEKISEFITTHKTIVTVARFAQEKNHWDLIKSFEILKERVSDAGLLFVGHMGVYEKEIKNMALKSEFSKDIMFVGFSSNPFKIVAASRVYALSSSNEGFTNSLVEAMAVGTPVVSTNCVTGPKEILLDNPNSEISTDNFTVADYGIMTPSFEPVADFDLNNKNILHRIYASALEKAICLDEDIKMISEKAYNRADFFDEKALLGKYEKLIKCI